MSEAEQDLLLKQIALFRDLFTSELSRVEQIHDLGVKRLEGLIAAERDIRLARREGDQDALREAKTDNSRRLNDMNNLRHQIESERGDYATRDMLDRVIGGVGTRISAIERWQFKIIGALILLTFLMPTLTGIIVYLVTSSTPK